jgi:transposase
VKENGLIFQQDNASIHCAKSTIKYIDDSGMPLMVFSTCSCDLNPIENLWAILKKRLCRFRFATREELCTAIRKEWNKIATEEGHVTLKNLVHSMPRRIKECIENDGNCTHY